MRGRDRDPVRGRDAEPFPAGGSVARKRDRARPPEDASSPRAGRQSGLPAPRATRQAFVALRQFWEEARRFILPVEMPLQMRRDQRSRALQIKSRAKGDGGPAEGTIRTSKE